MTTWPTTTHKGLPPASLLAEQIRTGTSTVDELSSTYGVGVTWVRQVLARAGWSASTGLPTRSRGAAPPSPQFLRVDSSWMDRAHCRTANDFPDLELTDQRALCRPCPVRTACLNYALSQQIEHGVWGGLTAPERARHRRRRS